VALSQCCAQDPCRHTHSSLSFPIIAYVGSLPWSFPGLLLSGHSPTCYDHPMLYLFAHRS
jgi:hypothetical protein